MKVIEIDTTKKYMFSLDENINEKDFKLIREAIGEFFSNDNPACIIRGTKLVKKVQEVEKNDHEN